MMTNFFVRLSGHDPKSAEADGPDVVHGHARWGALVLVAAFVAAGSWGLSFHGLFASNDGWGPFWAGLGAAIGFSLVVVMDRLALYIWDTQNGWLGRLIGLGLRVVMVLAMAAATSLQLAPHLLGDDLRAHALVLRESVDRETVQAARAIYDIDARRTEADTLARAAAEARMAIDTVPSNLEANLAQAQRVCAEHRRRVVALSQSREFVESIARDQRRAAAERRLAASGNACRVRSQTVEAAIAAYRTEKARIFNEANAARLTAEQRYLEARTRYEARLAETEGVRRAALGHRSSQVLDSLFAASWWTMAKYAVLSFFIAAFELSPLLLKLFTGRSVTGARICADRAVAVAAHASRAKTSREQVADEDAIRELMREGLHQALTSPSAVELVAAHFTDKIDLLLPAETARRLTAEIVAAANEIAAAQRMAPSQAAVIAAAWDNAVDDIVRRLRTSVPTRPSVLH